MLLGFRAISGIMLGLFVTSVAQQVYQMARAQGLNKQDGSAILQVLVVVFAENSAAVLGLASSPAELPALIDADGTIQTASGTWNRQLGHDLLQGLGLLVSEVVIAGQCKRLVERALVVAREQERPAAREGGDAVVLRRQDPAGFPEWRASRGT